MHVTKDILHLISLYLNFDEISNLLLICKKIFDDEYWNYRAKILFNKNDIRNVKDYKNKIRVINIKSFLKIHYNDEFDKMLLKWKKFRSLFYITNHAKDDSLDYLKNIPIQRDSIIEEYVDGPFVEFFIPNTNDCFFNGPCLFLYTDIIISKNKLKILDANILKMLNKIDEIFEKNKIKTIKLAFELENEYFKNIENMKHKKLVENSLIKYKLNQGKNADYFKKPCDSKYRIKFRLVEYLKEKGEFTYFYLQPLIFSIE